MTAWRHKARALADELSLSGDLLTPEWRDAISAVPRHELVPYYYTQNDHAAWIAVEQPNSIEDTDRDDGTDDDKDETRKADTWLDTIYSNITLITALAGPPGGRMAISSSTMPGLMVAMLETLKIRDGHRVLEIGTGTGYNAALLSHRLGSHNVFSVDIDHDLVELARGRLAAIGYTPTLVTRDGYQGLAEHSPFDRIIATCAVPTIPRAWIDQTTDGGLILADFKPSGMGGNLLLLQRQGETASGRFLPSWAGFMQIRHVNPVGTPRQPCRDHAGARERRTVAPPRPWLHPVPWFLAQFGMPENLTFGQHVSDVTGNAEFTFLSATNGSWCEVDMKEDGDGTRRVVEGGPTSLWGLFENAYEQWLATGEPDWSRFGVTVTREQHRVWLDGPDGNTWRSLTA